MLLKRFVDSFHSSHLFISLQCFVPEHLGYKSQIPESTSGHIDGCEHGHMPSSSNKLNAPLEFFTADKEYGERCTNETLS